MMLVKMKVLFSILVIYWEVIVCFRLSSYWDIVCLLEFDESYFYCC